MEIIKRKTEIEKETVDTHGLTKFQVSLNNYGHLTLRFYPSSLFDNEEKEQDKKQEDTIVTLDWNETRTLINFIQGTLKDRPLG